MLPQPILITPIPELTVRRHIFGFRFGRIVHIATNTGLTQVPYIYCACVSSDPSTQLADNFAPDSTPVPAFPLIPILCEVAYNREIAFMVRL